MFFILAFKYGNWESSIFRFGLLQNGHVDQYRFHLRIICFYFYSEYTNIRGSEFFFERIPILQRLKDHPIFWNPSTLKLLLKNDIWVYFFLQQFLSSLFMSNFKLRLKNKAMYFESILKYNCQHLCIFDHFLKQPNCQRICIKNTQWTKFVSFTLRNKKQKHFFVGH